MYHAVDMLAGPRVSSVGQQTAQLFSFNIQRGFSITPKQHV